MLPASSVAADISRPFTRLVRPSARGAPTWVRSLNRSPELSSAMAPDRAILFSILHSTLPSAAQANVSDSAPPYLPPELYQTAVDRTPDGWTLVSDETQRSRIASKVTAIVARILGVETEHVTESADLVADLGGRFAGFGRTDDDAGGGIWRGDTRRHVRIGALGQGRHRPDCTAHLLRSTPAGRARLPRNVSCGQAASAGTIAGTRRIPKANPRPYRLRARRSKCSPRRY